MSDFRNKQKANPKPMNLPISSLGSKQVKEKGMILKDLHDEPECFRAAHMPKFCWLLKDFNVQAKVQSATNKSSYKSRSHYFERKLNQAAASKNNN